MAIAVAMWTHGSSIEIEYPDRISSVWRSGLYTRIDGKPGTSNWLHFAIPTPVIVFDTRLKADSALIRFRTASVDAWVKSVHIYDGETKIASHDNLNLAPSEFSMERFDIPTNPEMRYGLGISIGVAFGVEMMSHRMEFSSAGCDFINSAPSSAQDISTGKVKSNSISKRKNRKRSR